MEIRFCINHGKIQQNQDINILYMLKIKQLVIQRRLDLDTREWMIGEVVKQQKSKGNHIGQGHQELKIN